jgi:hypothetical protein
MSVTTTAGGAWSATVKPLKNTSYEARVKTSTAATLAEKVPPRPTLSKAGRHRFRVRVSAAQSFSGKVAVFQRYKPLTGAWVRVRYVTLRTLATGSPTTVSGATFRSAIKKRQRVRVVLGPSQAGGCYTTGVSASIRS